MDYTNEILVNNGTFNDSYIKQKMFDEAEKPFTLKKTESFKKRTGKKIKIIIEYHS